jgi:hypothetical protein
MALPPGQRPYFSDMKGIWKSKLLWIGVVLLVALIVARAMLPIWVRDYVNKKLNELDDYRGSVSQVDIALIRGAYTIRDVKIEKTTGNVPVPFFSAPAVDLSVQWKALFHGALVGEIHFERPVINLVNGRSKATTQAPLDEPWTDKIRELFPLKINRATVRGGTVHYRDYSRKPAVNVEVDQLRMVATNLTNSRKLSETLNAEVEIEARALNSAAIRANIDMDPYAAKPTFAAEVEMENLPLVKLNDFAKAYAGITFEQGTLKLATAMKAQNGRFTGYVEPVFDNMAIFNPAKDNENPIDFIWQGIVGGLTRLIRNHPKDRFGTRVPISGSFDDPAPAVMDTVWNVFRNAFVRAFEGELKNSDIDLEELQKSGETKK